MNPIIGTLKKMRVAHRMPIDYYFQLSNEEIYLNTLLGRKLTLEFLGKVYCIQCGRITAKSFQQGYCFLCMRRINECNNCMIHPERCLVETGQCPKDDWAHTQCDAPQTVYLANSSGVKIGITRTTNIPTRWIDQGAVQALPLFETRNRYQCGLIEVVLKQYVADKTNWRAMLAGNVALIDLISEKKTLLEKAKTALAPILEKYLDQIILLTPEKAVEFTYPVQQYPTKVSSLSFDKTPEISGILQGVKGQYLVLDTGVLNVRKFGGYEMCFKVS